MLEKLTDIIAHITDGKSYKAHKCSLDYLEHEYLEQGGNTKIWKKSAEPSQRKIYKLITP